MSRQKHSNTDGRHRGKGRRQAAGPGEPRFTIRQATSVPLGPHMTAATLEEVMAAVEKLPEALDWPSLADDVVPVFQRRRPYPPGFPQPLQLFLPPGLLVGFGLDVGPAFIQIDASMVERWHIEPPDLASQALHNLGARARRLSPRDVERHAVADLRLRVLQTGSGSTSAFVLLPDELTRLFGPEPQCFIVPMRDLLVSLPADVDRAHAAWIRDEFAALDPNGLACEAFYLRDGGLTYEPLLPTVGMN